jgi:hypothetical protein
MTAIFPPRAFLPRAGRRIAPKAILAAAGLALLTAVTPVDPAHGIPPQSAPWCAAMGGSWGFDCSYFTFDQCMATARGLGNYCSPNPNAVVPPRKNARQQRPRYYIDQWGRRVRVR